MLVVGVGVVSILFFYLCFSYVFWSGGLIIFISVGWVYFEGWLMGDYFNLLGV